MARRYGQIHFGIWEDRDFRDLEVGPQRLYLFLISQPNINYAGVLSISTRRWAARAGNYSEKQLLEDLQVLIDRRYTVVDWAEEELLVRTYIRNDGLWKNPKTMKSASRDALAAASPTIRETIAAELERLPLEELPDRTREQITGEAEKLVRRLTDSPPTPSLPRNYPVATPSLEGDEGEANGSLPGSYGSVAVAVVGASSKDRTSVTLVEDSSAENPAGSDTAEDIREDVEQVCGHLADRVEENGSKRPKISKGWRTAARLMIDRDERTVDQIMRAIDWCQADEFWRARVMSMPKLRERYDQLRLDAKRKNGKSNGHAPVEPASIRNEWMRTRG